VRIKKGDNVEVIYGKDLGKVGRVLKVMPNEDKVVVEGINIVFRHTQASQENPQGGITENEAPVHISNVQLVCPHCGEKTRIGATVLDDGEKVRTCKKCDEYVDQ